MSPFRGPLRALRSVACRPALVASFVGACALTLPGSARAQQDSLQIFAGDSVRVNGELVGRVLSVRDGQMIVVSRGRPQCEASLWHGEPPVCDPAPILRRTVNIEGSTFERRYQKGNPNVRTAVGFAAGAAVFAGVGYFIGPAIGFGKVDDWGCFEGSSTAGDCPNGLFPRDEIERDQEARDHLRGALFFGLIGGTATAVFARKLSSGWVRVEPSVPVRGEDPWGLEVVLTGVR